MDFLRNRGKLEQIKIALYISGSETSRFAGGLTEYSLNGPTKLSPIVWVPDSDWISIFADSEITKKNILRSQSQFKIGLVLEPNALFPEVARAALELEKYFDLILTHDDVLLKKGLPFVPYIPGGIQISPQESIPVASKNKLLSLSASNKRTMEGHALRHQVVADMSQEFKFEVLGHGYKPYVSASDSYASFAYSIVIENNKSTYCMTEKLLEALLNKSIPIYWGAEITKSIFDNHGILTFDTLEDLRMILSSISMADYKSRKDAIETNFRTAQNYISKELNILRAICATGVIPNLRVSNNETTLVPGKLIEPNRIATLVLRKQYFWDILIRKFKRGIFRIRNIHRMVTYKNIARH